MKLNYLTVGATAAAVAATLLAGVNSAAAVSLTGLDTKNNLVFFDSTNPSTLTGTVGITGLKAGESLLGIDYRPATAELYGIGSTGQIYLINQFTGAASAVGSGFGAVMGNSFGVDFNPVPDRIRVVSNASQNLRLNPNNGTGIVDAPLAYAATDVNAGNPPNIVAAAYTNNFAGTTTTTLYGIDSALDILVLQNPPNAGVLNTVGALGVNFSNLAGFDILTQGGKNIAFASTGSSLYDINLATGAATLLGDIGGGTDLSGLAVTAVPEPATMTGIALGGGLLGMLRRRRSKSAN
jgi:hypothetical protein